MGVLSATSTSTNRRVEAFGFHPFFIFIFKDADGAAPGASGEAAAGEVADREGEGAAIGQATEARRPPKPENWGTMAKAQQKHWHKGGGKWR